MMGHTVLVLEDDADIAQLLCLHLKVLGHEVHRGASLKEGYRILKEQSIDAVVLDRGLEDGDGISLCHELRRQQKGLPILMLTAMDSESDMVEGFESGADDYMAKPFSVIEFQVRTRALLRRITHQEWDESERQQKQTAEESADSKVLSSSTHAAHDITPQLMFEHLEICPDTHSVRLDGQQIDLTPTEFSLLCCLAKRPERVFSKDELLSRVWNTDYDGYRHTVCCAVNRLRGKLERDPEMPKYIHTVWGVGYKFREAMTHAS